MKLVFCLFRYFPFGGLQRDFLRIARTCLQRGHEVKVYTMTWEGPPEEGLHIEILPTSGWQNHTRSRSFSQQLKKHLQHDQPDLVIGFNKMPGLDLYYAADVCYQTRIKAQRPFWYRWLPRYHQYLRDERAVFAAQIPPKILVLSAHQREEYHHCYAVPLDHFHLLPPGISKDRLAPPNANALRAAQRQAYEVEDDEEILLLVGSGFKTKGLDRILLGLASLPLSLREKTRLWIIGQDNFLPFLRLAKTLKVDQQITFLGGQHDITKFFLAADFLVHPAYHENTGTVLLEALATGLPVLTVATCGYAHYIDEAQAGIVLPAPFEQNNFNQHLEHMLQSPTRAIWRKNGLAFAQSADIFSLPEKAVDYIESLGC